MRIRFFFLSLLCLLLVACASSRRPIDVTTLTGLEGLTARPNPSNNCFVGGTARGSNIRAIALKDGAMSLGARGGLARRAQEINCILIKQEKTLDMTYNFQGMLLPHDVLPPVLVQAENPLNLASPDTIRLAQRIFKIEQQARFVTAPPTWRDYLWMHYPKPDVPHNSLLPKNAQEKEVWKYYIDLGWKQGIEQANSIFSANVARLKRDYNGMALYRKLYAQNMVSAPFVAKTELGITGDPTQMRIDDKVLRITALPELNLQSNTWRPAIVPGDPKPPLPVTDTGLEPYVRENR